MSSSLKRDTTNYISIQKDNSTGFISSELARSLSLKEGDYIRFDKGKEHAYDWFLYITQEKHNSARLSLPKSTTMWRFNYKNAVNQICDTFKIGLERVKLEVEIKNPIVKPDFNGDDTELFSITDRPWERYDLEEAEREKYFGEYINARKKATVPEN